VIGKPAPARRTLVHAVRCPLCHERFVAYGSHGPAPHPHEEPAGSKFKCGWVCCFTADIELRRQAAGMLAKHAARGFCRKLETGISGLT